MRRAFCVAVVLAAWWLAAPAAQDLQRPLELDREVYRRVLPNGFTYFVQRVRWNATVADPAPRRRLVLRLLVRAGSIDEADDERGLAHVLEHMAFNGTTRFPGREMMSYFASIGAKVGAHVNATTSYDATTYLLDVPTDREGAVGRAFEAMRDIAGGMTLDASEVDRERGVVIEEWRGRLGASSRMQGARMAALFGGSLYAARLPIGDPDVLRSFTVDQLRAFYRRHYRADRMALVIVGDILDPVADALMADLFADLPRSSGLRRLPVIPAHSDTRFAVLEDPEAQGVSVSIVHKRPLVPARTVGDFERRLLRALALRMVQVRFNEIASRPGAPIAPLGMVDQPLAGGIGTVTIGTLVPAGGTPEQAVAALAEEIARVRQHGFTPVELDRARRDLLLGFERTPTDPRAISESLVRHVLFDEPRPGARPALILATAFLGRVTVEAVNGSARELFDERDRVVLSSAPLRDGGSLVTVDALRAAFEAGATRPVAAWRSSPGSDVATARVPVSGSVTARRQIPDIGVTVLTLSNGVRVWLKPTTFGGDVLLGAIARGGASLVTPEHYLSASLSGPLVATAGAGALNAAARSARLAGRAVRVTPQVSLFTHGLAAAARPSDLEPALELMSLYVTAPNLDPAGFEPARRLFETVLTNQEGDPAFALREAVARINTGNHYAFRAPRVEDLSAIDPAVVASFYRERFANAGDFTFFLVGSFDEGALTPLLTRYIASLPSTGAATSAWREVGAAFPAGVVRETVRRGREPRSQTVLTFPADTGLDEVEVQRLRAASALVQSRLTNVLREDLGATYSVRVVYADQAPQRGLGTVTVQFGSAPEAAERLTATVLAELEQLQTVGPSAAEVAAVKATEARALSAALSQNAYWMSALQAAVLLDRDPRCIPRMVDVVAGLTARSLQETLQRYLPLTHHTIVSLLPEAEPAR